jgi:uncharacterized membrane protein
MTASHRRTYIDWARGLAVLLMIEAHTTDAWTRPGDKGSVAYALTVIVGGFAAPQFLWLAGLGVVLAASRIAARTGDRGEAVEATTRRGLEIFILAFLFRLQAFIASPPSTPLKLFRVDILNVMGPAMVGTALLWMAANTAAARVAIYAIAATAFAMLTPIVRATAALDWLPIWVQWYLRPSGEFTTFTLLPWAGFVFAGAAVGVLIVEADERSERRLHVGVATAGAALVALGFLAAAQPSIYRSSSFWTSSPTWFAIRTGILMMALTACYAAEQIELLRRARLAAWLAKMGRSSLFIYWIHVELVYGYASWLWRGRLPLWGTAVAYAAFCIAMYGAVLLRDRVVDTWRRIGRVQEAL